MTTLTPTKPEEWPIDPRFPGTNVPTPEALVAAARRHGFTIELGRWIVSDLRCGCAVGSAAMLMPESLGDIPWREIYSGLSHPHVELAQRLRVSPMTVLDMSSGFEDGLDDSDAADWGNKVAQLVGIDQLRIERDDEFDF